MVISDCLSLTLSEVFANDSQYTGDDLFSPGNSAFVDQETILIKAQQEWLSGMASLRQLLLSVLELGTTKKTKTQGLLLSSPIPLNYDSSLVNYLETGVFKVNPSATLALMPCDKMSVTNESISNSIIELPLLINDALRQEQFCLVFTENFALVILLGKDENGLAKFYFSFSPDLIIKTWLILKSRLLAIHHHQVGYIEQLIKEFYPVNPDYRIVSKFTRYLLNNLSKIAVESNQKTEKKVTTEMMDIPHKSTKISLKKTPLPPYPEIELLQALTHEIRTPLTTIRTMAKLLLKRAKLSPDLAKHLETIDQECTEQINRMELIFRAAELETKPSQKEQVKLVPISLEQLLTQSIPNWKKQAKRRNIELEIIRPQKLPQIVSEPAMLNQMLTGLIEKFTRNVPSGGEIKMLVSTAGNQLKLQFFAHNNYQNNNVKSLGQLLMFQPDTGSLSLNINVTKNIFNALGAKFVIRQKPQQGEVFTVFLPLGNSPKNLVNC
jgi:hypothetical protein